MIFKYQYKCVMTAAIALVCCLFSTSLEAQQNQFSLFVDEREGQVRVIWLPKVWPGDISGIQLKYRKSVMDSWVVVNQQAIEPGISAGKDLSNVGLDVGQENILQNGLQQALKEGAVESLSPGEFKAMVSPQPDFQLALRAEVFSDLRVALWLGLGLVDRKNRLVDGAQYGIFGVTGTGAVTDEPLMIQSVFKFQDDDERLIVNKLSVYATDMGPSVEWYFDEEKSQQWSIFAFHLYRKKFGGDEFDRISPQSGVTGPVDEHGQRYFNFVDQTAVTDQDYIYAVAPINIFGSEFATKTQIEYGNAAGMEGAIVLDKPTRDSEGKVVLSWNVEGAAVDLIDGFVVNRVVFPDGDFESLSTQPALEARRFTDHGVNNGEQLYGYMISGFNNEVIKWRSNIVTLMIANPVLPAQPSGFVAENIRVESDQYVHLQWDQATPGEAATDRYVLFSDLYEEGVLARIAGVNVILDREHTVKVAVLNSRDYRFAVAGTDSRGNVGPRAETTVFIQGDIIPAVLQVETLLPEGGEFLELSWAYPEQVAITGFRVYAGHRVLLDEYTLGPAARAWRIKFADLADVAELVVLAVSDEGVFSDPETVNIEALIAAPGVVE